MPRGDGTGPRGKGPGTGRGLGNCSDKRQDAPDLDEESGFLERLGRGLGLGRSNQNRRMGQGLRRNR